MSITFTPTAGVVTTYNCYIVDSADLRMPGDDVQNGVIRFTNDEPSLNMANSNALHFIKLLKLTPPFDADQVMERVEAYTGEFPAAQIDALIERIEAERANEEGNTFGSDPSYISSRLDDLLTIALHCKYHGCGFTWG